MKEAREKLPKLNEKLVALLSDADFQCRSAAASALASITVDEKAREHCAAATNVLSILPTICADPYDQVQRSKLPPD